MHDYRPHCVAIVHDHFGAHIQMENVSNTDQCNLIEDYPMIDGTPAQRDVLHEMYSTAAIPHKQTFPPHRKWFQMINFAISKRLLSHILSFFLSMHSVVTCLPL